MERQLLIAPDELAARLDDPALRIFDTAVTLEVREEGGYRAVSGRGGYEQAHVPGAAFMDLIKDLSDTSTGLGFTLPAPDALAQAVGAIGIAPDNHVVVYSSGHMMWATRAFWMLDWLGHEKVSVLDGGLARWQAEGHAVEAGSNTYPPARYTPKPRPGRFVRLDEMTRLTEEGGTCIANALSPAVYAGEGDFSYGRRGHIPGSLNLHYDELLNDGSFLPKDELARVLDAKGFGGTARSVAYCGGGISATIPAFARLLTGLDDTAVYDGSMSEWVREGRPLKTGQQP